MNRSAIIEQVRVEVEPLHYVYALWLEGADASDTVDEYSDLDVWLDFEDEYEEQAISAVEIALENLAPIDYKHIMPHGHPKIRQRVYHLSGTSEYLMIDFCWQLHSRTDCELIKDDRIEAAKVVFDKANVVRYKEYNIADFASANAVRLEECRYRYTQHNRVIKYVRRKQFAEAYCYYKRYVVEPLVDVLRLIYTPHHADYHLLHISRHIPTPELERLESYLRIGSLEDIEKKTQESVLWFTELVKKLQ